MTVLILLKATIQMISDEWSNCLDCTHLIVKTIISAFWPILRVFLAALRGLVFEVNLKCFGKGDGGQDAHDWGQGQHETNHHPGKVAGKDGVENHWNRTSKTFVTDVLHAAPDPSWKKQVPKANNTCDLPSHSATPQQGKASAKN